MLKEECERILQHKKVAIVAPAGHGKTEAIADMVLNSEGRHLILTHTNAGINSLAKRFNDRHIPRSKYSLQTIAAFCMRWCTAYPKTSMIDTTLLPQKDSEKYYSQLYTGAINIFSTTWAQASLIASYESVFVDEYQDCIVTQHEIFVSIATALPIRVFGDPMQGIFNWAGALVDWRTIEFPIEEPLQIPWRWTQTDPALGAWIAKIRTVLLQSLNDNVVTVDLTDRPSAVSVVQKVSFQETPWIFKLKGRTAFISNFKQRQENVSKSFGRYFKNHETQECSELYDIASTLDTSSGIVRCDEIMNFTLNCTSNLPSEISSYLSHIKNGDTEFKGIKKHPEIASILRSLCKEQYIAVPVGQWVEWIIVQPSITLYRQELLREFQRCIKYAEQNSMTYCEAAATIRAMPYLKKDYITRCNHISTRTVLSKGLEYDNVIVDMLSPLSSQDFYVAISRATKKVIIVTDESQLSLSPQKRKPS